MFYYVEQVPKLIYFKHTFKIPLYQCWTVWFASFNGRNVSLIFHCKGIAFILPRMCFLQSPLTKLIVTGHAVSLIQDALVQKHTRVDKMCECLKKNRFV